MQIIFAYSDRHTNNDLTLEISFYLADSEVMRLCNTPPYFVGSNTFSDTITKLDWTFELPEITDFEGHDFQVDLIVDSQAAKVFVFDRESKTI